MAKSRLTKKKPRTKPASKAQRPQLDLFAEGAQAAVQATGAATPPTLAVVTNDAEAAADQLTLVPTEPRAQRVTAESLATKQREISVSEFFAKNRHLLGFDNPSKALLTTIKEAVDNSLDACEEAGILPELTIEVHDLALEAAKQDAELTKGEGRFVVDRPGQRPRASSRRRCRRSSASCSTARSSTA